MGTPNSVNQPKQKVQNTAARLILRAPRHQNCTPFLQQLHCFPISERIKYKTVCMCYNAITGSAPSYLSELLHLYSPSALSALRQTHACSKSNASTAKPIIIMYIYHVLINALSAHMIHINLNVIFYTHVKHSPTKTIYIKYYLKYI